MTTPDILSPMVLGTMTFGDTVDTDGAGALLDVALDAGITHIDTANGYAAGAAERILSTLLAGTGHPRRHQLLLPLDEIVRQGACQIKTSKPG